MITVMIRSYESNPSHHHLNQSFFQNCHFRLISSFFFISKLLKIVKINKTTQAVWMLGKSCRPSPGFNGLLKLSIAAVSAKWGEFTMMYEDFWEAFKIDGGIFCLPKTALKCAIILEKLSKWFDDDFMCDFTWILTNLKLKKTTHLNKINKYAR